MLDAHQMEVSDQGESRWAWWQACWSAADSAEPDQEKSGCNEECNQRRRHVCHRWAGKREAKNNVNATREGERGIFGATQIFMTVQ
jgi:hypothetical protein